MTGKDLLDAIGYVDDSLLERCQQKEQIKAENQIPHRDKISWFRYGKKYISIAACFCLLAVFILGIAYRQYNLFDMGNSLVNGTAQRIIASLDVYYPKETEYLPNETDPTDTDSDFADDTPNKTEANNSYTLPDDSYQPESDSLPDMDDSADTEIAVEPTPNPGNTDNLLSSDTQIVKVDDTSSVSLSYSYGIKIEAVTEIPDQNPPPETTLPPSETISPEDIPSIKKILARNTAIIRGTAKKIEYFHVSGKKLDIYFLVVSLKVKEVYRTDGKGGPQIGTICKIFFPDIKASPRFRSSILEQITKGSEMIVMPYIADIDSGIRKNRAFFAFIDVSDYYLNEKTAESHLFLKTKTDILYDTRIYNIPYSGKKVTLNDVGKYLKKMLKK